MAQSQDRMDEYQLYASNAEAVGIEQEFLSLKEMVARWPLLRTEGLKGALFHPRNGYISPADMTQEMAKGARQHGALMSGRAGTISLWRS